MSGRSEAGTFQGRGIPRGKGDVIVSGPFRSRTRSTRVDPTRSAHARSTPSSLLRLGLALLVGLLSGLAGIPTALGAEPGYGAAGVAGMGVTGMERFVLDTGEGRTLRLPVPAATLFLADPEIADVQVVESTIVFLYAKKPGRTTLFALDSQGGTILSSRIVVQPPLALLRDVLEGELGVRTVTATYNRNGLVLGGTIPTPEMAKSARDIALQFLGEGAVVVNRIRITGETQVNLRVRVAEVSRDISRELGLNWSAMGSVGEGVIGVAVGRDIAKLGKAAASTAGVFGRGEVGGANVEAVVDALASNGLASILAEPNLTARSGQTANFLAGGEFPIPVSQGDGGVTTEFRRFGISLSFTPTVLSEDLISIRVRPEVSELTTQGSVTVDGFSIPGVSTRQVETSVDLASGQSFAIAGLIRNNFRTTLSGVPGLSQLPVLGALFRSTSFQRNETELLIIVTPYIVRPADGPEALPLPTDSLRAPNALEEIVLGRMAVPRPRPRPAFVAGPSVAGLRGGGLGDVWTPAYVAPPAAPALKGSGPSFFLQ